MKRQSKRPGVQIVHAETAVIRLSVPTPRALRSSDVPAEEWFNLVVRPRMNPLGATVEEILIHAEERARLAEQHGYDVTTVGPLLSLVHRVRESVGRADIESAVVAMHELTCVIGEQAVSKLVVDALPGYKTRHGAMLSRISGERKRQAGFAHGGRDVGWRREAAKRWERCPHLSERGMARMLKAELHLSEAEVTIRRVIARRKKRGLDQDRAT